MKIPGGLGDCTASEGLTSRYDELTESWDSSQSKKKNLGLVACAWNFCSEEREIGGSLGLPRQPPLVKSRPLRDPVSNKKVDGILSNDPEVVL